MYGHLAIFDAPAKVDSAVEGQFIERIARGAFRKTISENRRSIQVLYDHGKDPRFGRRPIARLTDLREDERGVYFEAEVLDTGTNREELIPGLRAQVFGSSFSFRPTKKPTIEHSPRASDINPDRWPEVTVTELRMSEFGPTPFPIYDTNPVGIRSITDEYLLAQLASDPERLRALFDRVGFALPKSEPAAATPTTGAAPQPAAPSTPPLSEQEWQQWLRNI
jgi:HK97 family phage prohead protease